MTWKLGNPLLLRSDLTGCVYVVSAYKVIEAGETGHDVIEALTKYDVTDQFERIMAAAQAQGQSGGDR